MVILLFTTGGGFVNALAFNGTNFGFSQLTDHGEEERKRHNLALGKLQWVRDQRNEDRMKWLDFINKSLRQANKAKVYINNLDDAMIEYYGVFAKQIMPLPPEPELSDFYQPSEIQENGELRFISLGSGIATYALYNYLK